MGTSGEADRGGQNTGRKPPAQCCCLLPAHRHGRSSMDEIMDDAAAHLPCPARIAFSASVGGNHITDIASGVRRICVWQRPNRLPAASASGATSPGGVTVPLDRQECEKRHSGAQKLSSLPLHL
jgi:hypothetical protein